MRCLGRRAGTRIRTMPAWWDFNSRASTGSRRASMDRTQLDMVVSCGLPLVMAYGNALTVLADPTRRKVFERLRAGPHPVHVLASGLPVSRPAVISIPRIPASISGPRAAPVTRATCRC